MTWFNILKKKPVDEAIDQLEDISEDYELDEKEWSSVDDASDYLFEHKVNDVGKQIGEVISRATNGGVDTSEENKMAGAVTSTSSGTSPLFNNKTGGYSIGKKRKRKERKNNC